MFRNDHLLASTHGAKRIKTTHDDEGGGAMKPDDTRLDELLKSLRVPERSPGYWERFPKRVVAQLRDRSNVAAGEKRSLPFLAWGIGLATACLAVGLTVGLWLGGRNTGGNGPAQLAENRKLFQEVAAMFPNRIQSIVVDANGVHLNLSDEANVPSSTPLL